MDRERMGWGGEEGDGHVSVKVKELCVCVCVCVCQREREREKQRDDWHVNAYSFSKVIAQTVKLFIAQDLCIHTVTILIGQAGPVHTLEDRR
jgi:hypothetical protein